MRRREIRMALRALDGQVVQWPYEHIRLIGARWPSLFSRRRYHAQTAISFRSALFTLKHHGRLMFEDQDFGSGFEVELRYAKGISVDGSIIGLNDDYDLTTPLARFLVLNEEIIKQPLGHLEGVLARYRHHNMKECLSKAETLTYRFLTHVYETIREPEGLAQSSIEFERDLRVRQLMVGSEMVFEASYARWSAVTTSELATWWYIFWVSCYPLFVSSDSNFALGRPMEAKPRHNQRPSEICFGVQSSLSDLGCVHAIAKSCVRELPDAKRSSTQETKIR